MRVIVPYANNARNHLADETRAALAQYAPQAEFCDVSQTDDSYWKLLCNVWSDGETFVVVEHDIILHDQVLPIFESCGHEWCGFWYLLSSGYHVCMGCTKFDAALMERYPNAMLGVGADFDDGMPARHWTRNDVRIERILLQGAGIKRHVHAPPVGHLNPGNTPTPGSTFPEPESCC